MAYSLKTRQEVLAQINQGATIKEASQMYNITQQTISNWLKSSSDCLTEAGTAHKHHDLEEKVEVLQLVASGDLSVSQIAELKNINRHTINGWIKDKSRILAVYSFQERRLLQAAKTIDSGEETTVMSRPDDKDSKQHIRDLKKENEFLKAKVAYLETLMELNGTPASGFKKKLNTRPSTQSSEGGSEQ